MARDYDGTNLVWCTDADELVSPRLVRRFLDERRAELAGGTVIDTLYCHFWNSPERYRTGLGGAYAPHLKPVAIVDDRRANYDRSRALPLHEERVPIAAGARRLKAEHVPVMHLQWLLPNRSQMRQAWYRCREWMQGGRTAAAINEQYAHTLPERYVPTAPVPHEWLDDVTLPGTAVRRAAVLARGRHPAVVRRARRGVLRADRDLGGATAPAGISPAGRPESPARSFVSAAPNRPGAKARAACAERGEAARHPVSRPSLTVLTLPILPAPQARLSVPARRGPLSRQTRRARASSIALSRALRAGAKRRGGTAIDGADFTFNPRTFGELSRVVYAPANEALRQAIELKRRRVVDYVVAGPVNALFADESGGILLAPEIDLVIVPSEWTVDFYEGFPELVAKSRVCPCGVDAECGNRRAGRRPKNAAR